MFGNRDFQNQRTSKKGKRKSLYIRAGFFRLLSNVHTIVPFLSSILQLKAGLILILISVLGLVEQGWLTGLFSLLGSLLFMMGGILLYHTVTRLGSFDGLISQAIRRVIHSQN